MGEGEAARYLRSLCKRRDARVRVQETIGAQAFFSTLTRAARESQEKPAPSVPRDLSRNKAGEVSELRSEFRFAKLPFRRIGFLIPFPSRT